MIKKNGHKLRTEKKIKYVRVKKPARNNLNAGIRKMIEEVYSNA